MGQIKRLLITMWIIKIGVAVSKMLKAKYFEISEEGLMKYHDILK